MDRKTVVLRNGRYWDSEPDTWETPDHTFVRMYSRHQRAELRWSVHLVGPGGECRREYQGPILPGPYAYFVPQPTVIAAYRQPERIIDEISTGDIVRISCLDMSDLDDLKIAHEFDFKVADDRIANNPQLELVEN